MANETQTSNWPDLAIGLYDRLTGRNAEIAYDFDDLQIEVPSGVGEEANHAKWLINGGVRITTRDRESSPN